MEDADLVRAVAADHLLARGSAALSYLRDQQEIAEESGDAASAEAWRDIADTADAILARIIGHSRLAGSSRREGDRCPAGPTL